jgi:predicted RNA-binding Zn ribbon-like protein
VRSNGPSQKEASELSHVGGALWIDFANTLEFGNHGLLDPLEEIDGLLYWWNAHGLQWGERSVPVSWMAEARQFRRGLVGCLQVLANGADVLSLDLTLLNEVLRNQCVGSELTVDGQALRRREVRRAETAVQLLGVLAESAANCLLTHSPRDIKKCDNPNCGFYFLDQSKNRGRRWCSMAICGNRMKAATFYRRNHKGKQRPPP